MDGDVFEAVVNLGGEFTRGREYERARSAARPRHEMMQNRQQKRVRFAAAGHGAGEQVAALEGRRNAFALNGRGPGESEVLETLQKARMKLKRCKRL